LLDLGDTSQIQQTPSCQRHDCCDTCRKEDVCPDAYPRCVKSHAKPKSCSECQGCGRWAEEQKDFVTASDLIKRRHHQVHLDERSGKSKRELVNSPRYRSAPRGDQYIMRTTGMSPYQVKAARQGLAADPRKRIETLQRIRDGRLEDQKEGSS